MPMFTLNLAAPAVLLEHACEHTVGSDHAPIALEADWQTQLRRCRTKLGFRNVRFHGLLSNEMGMLSEKDEPLYSFFSDRIIDVLLSIGLRPFIELSFVPDMFAPRSTTVFWYRGNITPPRDYLTGGWL